MKRKVLISVLAIALVLTLCIGIFAACDPKECTVTYSLGECEGTAPAAQKVKTGAKTTLPEVVTTWEGHYFMGWKAGADGDLLQPGTEVEVKADITYTAQWGSQYTVSFSLGTDFAGTGTAPAAQKVNAGSKATLPTVDATWKGYTFAGWKAGAEGALLQPGAEVDVTADITYTAQWSLYKVTVYGEDSTKLGDKFAVEYEEGKYYISDPAQDYSSIKAPKGKIVTYQLYDPATQTKKGAFDINNFQADGDISIIVVYEEVGTVATSLPANWGGYFALETVMGDAYTAEIATGEDAGITLKLQFHGEEATVLGTIAGQNIWTKEGAYILCYEESVPVFDDDDPTAAPTTETMYHYFSLALSQDGSKLTVTCLTDSFEGPYEFAKKPDTITVTVYGNDDSKLGDITATRSGNDYSMANPATQYELKADENSYFSFKLYDPDTKKTTGDFDYKKFQANGGISIKVVAETLSDDVAATEIDEKWYGTYMLEQNTGEFSTAEISDTNINVYFDIKDVHGTPTETFKPNGIIRFKNIWLKDGNYIVGEEHLVDPANPKGEKTKPVYYALSLSADGNTLTVSNLSDLEASSYTFTRKPEYTVTVHYTLNDGQKTDEMKTESISKTKDYKLADPLNGSGAISDADDIKAALKAGEYYKYYYYDATATDHKGKEFGCNKFDATANFDIIIIKESVGTVATAIDSSWIGIYEGKDAMGSTHKITISDEEGGKIIVDENTEGYIAANQIFNAPDGKLVLATQSYSGTRFYYFTKTADTIKMESEGEEAITLTKCKTINVTINYHIGEDLKQTTATAVFSEGSYGLDHSPEWYIDEPDYGTLIDGLKYGQRLTYFFYNSQTKSDEFVWDNFEAEGDVSIIIETETFANKVDSIDTKFNGRFSGKTMSADDITIDISATEGTVHVVVGYDVDYEISLTEANGKILKATAGDCLVIAYKESEYGSVLDARYFYLEYKNGEYLYTDSGSRFDKDVKLEKSATYNGPITVDETSKFIITKIEIDNLKNPSKVTVYYDRDNDTGLKSTVYLSADDPDSLSDSPKGKPAHYYDHLRAGTVIKPGWFGLAIYEDGTVVIANGDGKYVGELTKAAE